MPIVVGFLVDLSNSAKIHWDKYQEAIRDLIWDLLPGDQKYSGYLISYGTDATLEVDTTTDGNKLAERVAKLKPGGASALYDAIYMACTRRIVVPRRKPSSLPPAPVADTRSSTALSANSLHPIELVAQLLSQLPA